MDTKEKIINNVLIAMHAHVNSENLLILENILKKTLWKVDITEKQTQVATVNDTNDYIIELFKVKKAPKLSERTVNQYLKHILLLIDYIKKPLVMMTENDIDYFLMSYKKKGNSNVTVNNCRRFLSAFFTWMRRAKLVHENPVEDVDAYKETVKQIEHLEPEQWEQLKGGCKSNRDRALIEFLRCTAMRVGEVPLVKINDIDWITGKIIIYGKKSDRYRTVCIDRLAKDYLGKYLLERKVSYDSSEPLFIGYFNNKVLNSSGIYSAVKLIGKQAKMKINIYPHLIRKTTATNIIRRGGSSEEAGEYLGHTEHNTAGKYYAFKGEEHIIEIFKTKVAAI